MKRPCVAPQPAVRRRFAARHVRAWELVIPADLHCRHPSGELSHSDRRCHDRVCDQATRCRDMGCLSSTWRRGTMTCGTVAGTPGSIRRAPRWARIPQVTAPTKSAWFGVMPGLKLPNARNRIALDGGGVPHERTERRARDDVFRHRVHPARPAARLRRPEGRQALARHATRQHRCVVGESDRLASCAPGRRTSCSRRSRRRPSSRWS